MTADQNWDFVHVPIEDIRERESNPNRMDPERFSMLVQAIRTVGFLQPILVRHTSAGSRESVEVVDGHHRLRAARELGLEQVPCVVVQREEDVALALQMGMNRLRGELDLSVVAADLAGLQAAGWSEDQLALTGFTAEEVRDLVETTHHDADDVMTSAFNPPEVRDGPAPAADKPWVLEVPFRDRKEFLRAKRGLKRAAGESKDLAKGLLRLLAEG